MERLIDVSEAMRIALIGAESLPAVTAQKQEAVRLQQYDKAHGLRQEELRLIGLMPKIEDLKQWKEIIDKHI